MEKKQMAFLPVSSGEITKYHDEGKSFFESVLKLDYNRCLVDDDTKLFEFAGKGIPAELDVDVDAPGIRTTKMESLFSIWDVWVMDEIYKIYHIKLRTTNTYLVELFKEIRETWGKRMRPH